MYGNGGVLTRSALGRCVYANSSAMFRDDITTFQSGIHKENKHWYTEGPRTEDPGRHEPFCFL